MAVLLTVNDVIEARLEFSIIGNSDKAFNILHYRVSSIVDSNTGLPAAVGVNADSLIPPAALAMFTALSGGWVNCGSANVGATSISLQKVHTGVRSEEYTYTPNAPVVGDIPGDSLPLQDCATMLKKTGIGERWGMGRLFVCGMPEDSQSNGRILDLALGGYEQFGDALMTNIGATGGGYTMNLRPCLFTRDTAGVRINDLTRVVLSNNIVKSQKRRRPGKGI